MGRAEDDILRDSEQRVGATLNGKWHLDHLIDVGGMAAVYAATHRNGNRVAVKVLHQAYHNLPTVKERFLREGYLANKVVHPGAVTVLDDDSAENGDVFLVMELLEGQSMEGLLQRTQHGLIGCAHALAIADQLLDVLAVAHSGGVIHRDIKPGNIFLTRDGRVKVLDFGLARLLEASPSAALTGVGTIMGTSAYMAPEQAQSKWKALDGRTDLFAVGAVMFRALSNQFVHQGQTPTDRLISAMTKQPQSLSLVAPQIPQQVVDVVDRALAFEMSSRWPDATTMQHAVREAFASLPRRESKPAGAPIAPEKSIDIELVDDGAQSVPSAASQASTLGIDDMITIPPNLIDRLPEVSALLIEGIIATSTIDESDKRQA